MPIAEALITAGYRVLAKTYHPDQGGTHEQMTRLNLVVEHLRETVRSGERGRSRSSCPTSTTARSRPSTWRTSRKSGLTDETIRSRRSARSPRT